MTTQSGSLRSYLDLVILGSAFAQLVQVDECWRGILFIDIDKRHTTNTKTPGCSFVEKSGGVSRHSDKSSSFEKLPQQKTAVAITVHHLNVNAGEY